MKTLIRKPRRTRFTVDSAEAEARGNGWLAEGNAARERGDLKRAELCDRKGQYWLDRYNRLTGRA